MKPLFRDPGKQDHQRKKGRLKRSHLIERRLMGQQIHHVLPTDQSARIASATARSKTTTGLGVGQMPVLADENSNPEFDDVARLAEAPP
jgi:hypothetical protein